MPLSTRIVLLFACAASAFSQGLVSVAKYARIAPGTTATSLEFTVEPDSDSFFDVIVVGPKASVSLVLPSQAVVTKASAAVMGFEWEETEGPAVTDFPALSFWFPGAHTMIAIPDGQPPGPYRLKIDTPGNKTRGGLMAFYYPSSTISSEIATDSDTYSLGDPVTITASTFDGDSPLKEVSATAEVTQVHPVDDQVHFRYRLADSKTIRPTLVEKRYAVTIENRGTALSDVIAEPLNSPSDTAVDYNLFWTAVKRGESQENDSLFVVRYDPATNFDPQDLVWSVTAVGSVTRVPFVSVEGTYRAVFTPKEPGKYSIETRVSGKSAAGIAFERTPSAEFDVVAR